MKGFAPCPQCPFDGRGCHYPCDKLYLAHHWLKVSRRQLAEVLGVHVRTWNRYRDGRQRPHRAVCIAVAALQGHVQAAGWSGWFFHRGDHKLYFLELRDGFTPQQIAALSFKYQEVTALRRRAQLLEAELQRERDRHTTPDLFAVAAGKSS